MKRSSGDHCLVDRTCPPVPLHQVHHCFGSRDSHLVSPSPPFTNTDSVYYRPRVIGRQWWFILIEVTSADHRRKSAPAFRFRAALLFANGHRSVLLNLVPLLLHWNHRQLCYFKIIIFPYFLLQGRNTT